MTEIRDIPKILSIAGTDPTAGAGIQADLKSISANHGYGMTVITALVAQNIQGVSAVFAPPTDFLRAQLVAVSNDVSIDAIKIGMLFNEEIIATINEWLDEIPDAAVVIDPVMVATSGDHLLEPEAEKALFELLKRADLVTPNIPELAVLCGVDVAESLDEAIAQGVALSASLNTRVLVKGGHLGGVELNDALVFPDGEITLFSSQRLTSKNTHGTGCSLSSAIATNYARCGSWPKAVARSRDWLHQAIKHADALEVGKGHGPVHHFAELWTRN